MWGKDRARRQRNTCGTHTVWEWMRSSKYLSKLAKKTHFLAPALDIRLPAVNLFRAGLTPLATAD
jgi:hypothetical protein